MNTMPDFGRSEYEALRATIRERGTLRVWTALIGLALWGFLALGLLFIEFEGAVVLVPLVVLGATFEISFFIHTGVERIGRYLQVFFEEKQAMGAWETTAMSYGQRFAGGSDPLFTWLFAAAAAVNFFSSVAISSTEWLIGSLFAHLAFGWRLLKAKRIAAGQRAIDLERYRSLEKGSGGFSAGS